MKATWKIINTETGRFIKRDHTQYLIDKYCYMCEVPLVQQR
jgi:hypothetical protein